MKPQSDYEIASEKAYLKYRDECRAWFKANPEPIRTRPEQLVESAKSVIIVRDAMGDFYGNHRIHSEMAIHKFTNEELVQTIKELDND